MYETHPEFLLMSMTLRTNLANVQTSTCTGPSRHSFIGWAWITQMRSYFLSMGSTAYVNIFITSTLLFYKPRRKKKRFKDEAEANKQTIFILILTHNQKLKFKISNIKSMSQKQMVMLLQAFLIEIPLILKLNFTHYGHPRNFGIKI
jgi:hypothetical protein